MLTVRKIENVAVGANSKPKLPIVISQTGVRSSAREPLVFLCTSFHPPLCPAGDVRLR